MTIYDHFSIETTCDLGIPHVKETPYGEINYFDSGHQ